MKLIKTSIIVIFAFIVLAQSAAGSDLPQVTKLTQLTDDTSNEYDASWGPDDTSIVYISEGSTYNNLKIIDLDGSGKNRNYCTNFLLHPDWGQGGILYIATDSNPQNPHEMIYIISDDLFNPHPLTEITNVRNPSWNNDGSKILFLRLLNYNYEIWTMDSDGSNAVGLTDLQTTLDSPSWSYDGTRIAFCVDNDIWVMDADGSNFARLTNDDYIQTSPVWNPDGEWIAYTSNDNGWNDIWVIRTDGTDKTLLVSESRDMAHLDWNHDGTMLLYTSYQNGNGDIWAADVLIPQTTPVSTAVSTPAVVDEETKTNIARLIVLGVASVLSVLVLLFVISMILKGMRNRSHRKLIHHQV